MTAGLPVVLRIAGQRVILIGTGEAAQAKRRLLERAGALVTDDEGADARFAWLTGANSDAVAARLKARGVLVNVADRTALCDFIMPAIVERSPVLVAVTTGGVSAGLSGAIRQRLETLLPPGLGQVAELLRVRGGALRARVPDPVARRRILDQLLMLDAEQAAAWIESAGETVSQRVTIRLRSPDPDDLTLREARLLGQADRVYHASDAPTSVLERARADAVRLTGAAPAGDEPGLTVLLENPA